MVSVVIPVYNSEKSIERCANSVLNQDYQDLELILVNDGSKDNSGSMCDHIAELDSRVVVIHKENGGVSSARNLGIENSKGDFITFVDADDELVPNAITTALHYINKYNADVVTYGWNIVGKDEQSVCEEFEVINDDVENVLKKILTNYSGYGGGYPWNKLWRMDSFDNFPKFNTSLYYFEDLEWVVQALKKVKTIVVCPECLYKYYYNDASVTHSALLTEKREIGYHNSIVTIIDDLSDYPELKIWFSNKYYPEVVNGIIGALKYNYTKLKAYLKSVFNSNKIAVKASCQKSIVLKLKFFLVSIYLLIG